MCPAEIGYNKKQPPGIRLLPIETRGTGKSLQQLKREDTQWTTVHLDTDDEDAMSISLKELVREREVPVEQARKLGFEVTREMAEHADEGTIKIPHWRHAMINYPHPLLQQGVVIIDTPGLNALGSEPELTLRILSQTQAVVFVLAADTGVTQSDMQIWVNHVCVATRSKSNSRIVVLNKVDTLWDELRSEGEVKAQLISQLTETSRLLRHPAESLFPVSATKGLLAKFRRDDSLMVKSGLARLEHKLSTEVVPAKAQIMRDGILDKVQAILDEIKQRNANKQKVRDRKIAELESLRGKSQGVIRATIDSLEEEKTHFESRVRKFGKVDKQLKKEMRDFLDALDPKRHDEIFEKARVSMKKSMTTHSLKSSMSKLFKEIEYSMKRAEAQSERIRGHIDHSYKAFHADHGLPKMKPAQFDSRNWLTRLQGLLQDAEAYRDSSKLMMTEQHYLVQNFMVTMVSHIRSLLDETHKAAFTWSNTVLNPIRHEISRHKDAFEERLENLTRLKESQLDIDKSVHALAAEIEQEKQGMRQLASVLARIQHSAILPGAEQNREKTGS